jgi:hypothetical protein
MNPFTHPHLFKIDTKSLTRTANKSKGGQKRAEQLNGQPVVGMGQRDLDKTKINLKRPK